MTTNSGEGLLSVGKQNNYEGAKMIQNMAQLKRFLIEGAVIINTRGPINTDGKRLKRTVKRVQTNGVWFEREEKPTPLSYLEFPKASKVVFNENGFTINESLEYEIA